MSMCESIPFSWRWKGWKGSQTMHDPKSRPRRFRGALGVVQTHRSSDIRRGFPAERVDPRRNKGTVKKHHLEIFGKWFVEILRPNQFVVPIMLNVLWLNRLGFPSWYENSQLSLTPPIIFRIQTPHKIPLASMGRRWGLCFYAFFAWFSPPFSWAIAPH